MEQNQSYLEIGKAEGARLIEGGDLLKRPTRGHFMSPALFVDSDNGLRINREEMFGPVAGVIRARDYEALQVANDTPFGLASSICTSSQKYASHFRRYSQAGLVMVNLPTAGYEYHVPFGGTKAPELWLARAGSLRSGVLHDREDVVHAASLKELR